MDEKQEVIILEFIEENPKIYEWMNQVGAWTRS